MMFVIYVSLLLGPDRVETGDDFLQSAFQQHANAAETLGLDVAPDQLFRERAEVAGQFRGGSAAHRLEGQLPGKILGKGGDLGRGDCVYCL